MGIIAWIVLGAIAGSIAGSLTGERTGILVASVVGIVGAVLGGVIAEKLFHVQTLNTFFNASTWITAIVGALLLMLLVRSLSGRRGAHR